MDISAGYRATLILEVEAIAPCKRAHAAEYGQLSHDGRYIRFEVADPDDSQRLVDYYYTWDCKAQVQMAYEDTAIMSEDSDVLFELRLPKYYVRGHHMVVIRNFCHIHDIQIVDGRESVVLIGPKPLLQEIVVYLLERGYKL